tara:strand:+ start:8223 stop:8483 length:261 start_codon:yes stop_codon:yes gene_type:complete
MEIQTVEHNILIAERVKGKGDTWILIGEDVEHPSLTETLEAYFQKTGNNVHFRLEPLNSKLFAISKQEEEVVIEPPKHFNIYGDFD